MMFIFLAWPKTYKMYATRTSSLMNERDAKDKKRDDIINYG